LSTPVVPPRTLAELARPAAPGGRHEQARRIIFSLVAQGFCGEAIFAQIRGMYAADFKDTEIWHLIRGAVRRNPLPAGHDDHRYQTRSRPATARRSPPVTTEKAVAAAERFLRGFRCNEADFCDASPWRPLEDWRMDSLMVFAGLFYGEEHVNVVAEHVDGRPVGAGQTMLRDEWLRRFRDQGMPQCPAGAWFRFNPVREKGSGMGGAICDADVTSFRFMLLESDKLPMELQLSFLGKLRFPVAALISSGGKSVHCLIRMDCADRDKYREQSGRILDMLLPYGFDAANKNSSRMTRLPGVARQIGANANGEQRLLFFSPDAAHGEGIFT
jgi:hypothetical protein